MNAFDPNAAASSGSGIFGLPGTESPFSAAEAALVIMPVPFAATVSYGGGAERGPGAVLAASHQVDLYDLQFGRVYERGIHLLQPEAAIEAAHARARAICLELADGADDPIRRGVVDEAGAFVNERVHAVVAGLLDRGVIPAVLGGDHSVPFGAIAAVAERYPGLGILHIDAHADLRVAYEGYRWSHASIMDNVLREAPGVARIVQVGIRDFCEQELMAIQDSGGRVVTHFDHEWRRRLFDGETFAALCADAIEALPSRVHVSFDIDGLGPALCPSTGTPVPSGLAFAEMSLLLESLVRSGRSIVGFDLVEVAPGADEWDANVGARVLYKLCGAALRSARRDG
ncbi:MAG: agmatinase family protein [Planctomycetes bacterium]|nr:agmatinase family protein [Planctomycetota bacterium]